MPNHIDEIIQITNENVGVQDFEPFHNKILQHDSLKTTTRPKQK